MPSAEELSQRMYNAGMDAAYGNYLFNRDFKGLYKALYKDIYQRTSGTPAGVSYFYMGACLEMGMGGCEVSTYKAQAHYEKGASLGDSKSQQRLRDIKSSGYWGASSQNHEIFARLYAKVPSSGPAPSYPSNGNNNNNNNNNNSSSDYGYYDCPTCHGTGICQTCNGKGWYYSPYTTGTIVCGNCTNQNGKCPWCNGTGKKYGRIR